jgi:hypothetical protein
MTNGNGWFFVETSEALTQLLSNCSASAPSVDFSKEHVIVACYDCACQGVVSISQLRECEGSVVLDYSYAEVCAECDGCLTRCAAVAVSKDVQNVTANFASIPPTCP